MQLTLLLLSHHSKHLRNRRNPNCDRRTSPIDARVQLVRLTSRRHLSPSWIRRLHHRLYLLGRTSRRHAVGGCLGRHDGRIRALRGGSAVWNWGLLLDGGHVRRCRAPRRQRTALHFARLLAQGASMEAATQAPRVSLRRNVQGHEQPGESRLKRMPRFSAGLSGGEGKPAGNRLLVSRFVRGRRREGRPERFSVFSELSAA